MELEREKEERMKGGGDGGRKTEGRENEREGGGERKREGRENGEEGERSRETPRQTDRQRGPTPTHVNIIFV